jgi:hypothetical protein
MSGDPYHKLSITAKRTEALARAREPAVMCPSCDTQVMPVDMLVHLELRCTGPREPGPGAKWVTWKEAIAMVPERTFRRWVRRGYVRFERGRGDRLYLLRDLVLRVALRQANRRR